VLLFQYNLVPASGR